MRQLAEALGCSPKTPYRYFKDKADILATVRAQAFAKFADTLEKACAASKDPASAAG
jgi:AcrR family transcriptional regulator